MRGWQANKKRTCALPVVLGLCPKRKYPPLCGGIFIASCDIFHAEISRMWWKEVFFEPEEVHCATIYCGLIYYIFYHNWKNENAASGKEGMRIYVLFGIYYKAKCIFLRFRPLFAGSRGHRSGPSGRHVLNQQRCFPPDGSALLPISGGTARQPG